MSVSRQRRHLQLLLLLFLQSTIHAPSPIVAAQNAPNDQDSSDAHEQARNLLTNYFNSLLNLQVKYPELVTVQDATDVFPILINSAPSCLFAYGSSPAGRCFTPIVSVYDAISNEPHEASLNAGGVETIALPQILLLSALDANQMDLLSPFSMYQTLSTLLECAHCESLSPYVNSTLTSKAIECRQSLHERGIDDTIRKWMARLVVTREIVLVPIVDVGGFYSRLVDELSDGSDDMDMMQYDYSAGECDFPSPMHDSDHEVACMNTYPARIINELFHSHSFQLGLSFHQSTDSSGYIEIPSWDTGDEVAMREISTALAQFGSINAQPYEVRVANVTNIGQNNTCNGITMENWAFSAGFSGITFDMEGKIRLEQCVCKSQDGSCDYPMERTSLYDRSSLRSFIARVVSPPTPTADILNLPGYTSNIPSNHSTIFDPTTLGTQIRMSLTAIDLLQPWTSITSIAGVSIRDDIVPLSPRYTESCSRTKVMKLPTSPSNTNVTVKWTVGGSTTIDETAIMYGEWNVLDKKIFNCVSQPTKEELDTFFAILRDFEEREGETEEEMETEVTFTTVQSGHSTQNDDGVMPETTFSVSLDLSRYKVGDVIAVYALARVDQKWARIISEEEGTSSPAESNIVNARTNPEWTIYQRHGNNEATIRGQLDFFSIPVTIEMEERPGFFEGTDIIDASVRLSDVDFIDKQDEEDGVIVYALFMAVLTIVVVFLCTFCREQSDGTDVLAVLSI